MKIKIHSLLFVVILSFIISCQNDKDYEEQQPEIIAYDFSIPGELEIKILQHSDFSISDPKPYISRLKISNISNNRFISTGTLMFQVFDDLPYTLRYLRHQSFSDIIDLDIGESDTINLPNLNFTLVDKNARIVILDMNRTRHFLSGFYKGEANIYSTVDTTFLETFRLQGYIDYKGKFFFDNEDFSNTDFSSFRGSITALGLIDGIILDNNQDNIGEFMSNNAPLVMQARGISDTLKINHDSSERLLEFNLSRTN